MLRRKIYDMLLAWKKSKKQECLLVKGARQVGKSFIIRKFGQDNYSSVIEINFYEHPEYKQIFEGDLSASEIYKRMSLYVPNISFAEGDTLIFLDEIQHCPNARTAIKFLAMDGRYDVISSGSLLGLHYKEIVSVPVGYERQLDMYALDFEEFLWAYGYDENAVAALKEYFTTATKIPFSLNEKLHRLMREYLVVGGMPAVVNLFFETSSFQSVYKEQCSILQEYETDIKKYAGIYNRQKIRDCYWSVPRQLAKEYTKFRYSAVSANGSTRKYQNALDWLIDAGMISKVCNVSVPLMPLVAYEQPAQFKVYVTDIGLLTAMYGFETQTALVNDALTGPAKGGIYENLIFDMLNKRGYKLNYYKNGDNSQEIEFLIEQNGAVVPIEVKSKSGRTLSLNEFLRNWAPPLSYKLVGANLGVSDGKFTIPHYLAMFI